MGAGAAALWARGHRLPAAIPLAAVAGGILWSNALAYQDVNLAPHGQLAELQRQLELQERLQLVGPGNLLNRLPMKINVIVNYGDSVLAIGDAGGQVIRVRIAGASPVVQHPPDVAERGIVIPRNFLQSRKNDRRVARNRFDEMQAGPLRLLRPGAERA